MKLSTSGCRHVLGASSAPRISYVRARYYIVKKSTLTRQPSRTNATLLGRGISGEVGGVLAFAHAITVALSGQ